MPAQPSQVRPPTRPIPHPHVTLQFPPLAPKCEQAYPGGDLDEERQRVGIQPQQALLVLVMTT